MLRPTNRQFDQEFFVDIEEMLARESIRQTLANYTLAGDRLKVDEFIAVFTETAIMESEYVPDADAFRYEGRDEIKGWLTRWSNPKTAEQQAHQASFARHHLSTCQIQLNGDNSATVRTYWTAYTDIGADHCGYYLDRFEKVGEQWLIAHRRVRLDWRSPDSLFGTAIERTRKR